MAPGSTLTGFYLNASGQRELLHTIVGTDSDTLLEHVGETRSELWPPAYNKWRPRQLITSGGRASL